MKSSQSRLWRLVGVIVLGVLGVSRPTHLAASDRYEADATGSIAGRVTQAGGESPITTAFVTLYTGDTNTYQTNSYTDNSGEYRFDNLVDGGYKICVQDFSSFYAPGCYDNQFAVISATLVSVNNGEARTGINIALQPFAFLTGTVTDAASGTGLPNINVYASPIEAPSTQLGTNTDSNGQYLLRVRPGQYKILFWDAWRQRAPLYYDNRLSRNSATVISASAGVTLTQLNAGLSLPGHIAGTLINRYTGQAIDAYGATITAYEAISDTPLQTTYAAFSGTYVLQGLAPGAYKIGVTDTSLRFAPAFFENQSSLQQANTVQVTAGITRTQIDVALSPLGVLQGRVLDDQSGALLTGIPVRVYDAAQQGGYFIASTTTDANGFYRIAPVPPGRYKVGFAVGAAVGYAPRYYPNASTLAEGQAIDIPNTTQPIEIDMTLRAESGNPVAVIGQMGGLITALTVQGQYAYAGIGLRLAALSLSSPNNPQRVGQSSPLTAPLQDIAVNGKYAYGANGYGGLKVFDIADVAQLRQVNTLSLPGSATGIALHNTHAYVIGGGVTNALHILSLTNPASPNLLSTVVMSYAITHITTANGRAYLGTANGMKVYDLAQPTSPMLVGELNTGGSVNRIKIAGTTALLVSSDISSKKVWVVDLGPLSVTRIYSGTQSYFGPSDVAVAGRSAYIAAGTGLQVMNLDNPADVKPVPINQGSDQNLSLSRIFIAGNSGNQLLVINSYGSIYSISIGEKKTFVAGELAPFRGNGQAIVSGNLAYLADGSRGVAIISLANPAAPEILSPASNAPTETAPVAQAYSVALSGDGVTLFSLGDWDYDLTALDVRNPRAPVGLGGFYTYTLPYPHTLVISGTHAWVGHDKGLVGINISNPAKMAVVSNLENLSPTLSVQVWGQYAFLISNHTLTAINIQNASAPTIAGQLDLSFTQAAALSYPYLYLAGGSTMRIIDISNPAAMSERAILQLSDFVAGRFLLSGQRLYLPLNGRVAVYDLGIPTQPREVGVVSIAEMPQAMWAYGGHLFVSGIYLGLQSYWAKPPTSQLVSSLGGGLIAPEDSVRYSFGPHTLGQLTLITHRSLAPSQSPPIPGNLQQLSPVYEITAPGTPPVVVPAQPFTLSVQVSSANGLALQPTARTPNLYFWDAIHKRWNTAANATMNNGEISAATTQFGLWAVMTPANGFYLPLALRESNTAKPDLRIVSFEVTQGMQTPQNNIPLVANRPTMLRVYATTSVPLPINDVLVRLTGARNGAPLPGSPITIGPWAAFASATPASLSRSFNIPLPADWLSGQVTLNIVADPDNVIAETNESNNTATASLQFNGVPPLKVTLVPITYKHLPTGRTYPANTQDFASAPLMEMYPIHAVAVTVRTPIYFEGNLSQINDWLRLINLISALKAADGAPAAVAYYGVVPTGQTNADSYPIAVGGLGAIGFRYAVGVANDRTLAHELGHNFGLPHAPCGGAGGPDPNYPHANASIGQYGFNLATYDIYSPATVKDMMSYCWPNWFSDYNYTKLYHNQRTKGQAIQNTAQESLLIRVAINAEGQPSLSPVYALQAPLTPEPDSPDEERVTLEILDADGQVIARAPAALHPIADGNPLNQRNPHLAVAVIARPAQPMAAIRVIQIGRTVFTRPLVDYAQHSALQPDQPQLRFSQPELVQASDPNGQRRLRWGAPNMPALVRYSDDGGLTWTTLGIDVLGGELPLDDALVLQGKEIVEVVLGNTTQPISRYFRPSRPSLSAPAPPRTESRHSQSLWPA